MTKEEFKSKKEIINSKMNELKETKRNDCLKCSLRDLCLGEFGIACLCWINLASELEVINTEFKCRGKVTDNVSVEKAIEVLSSILESWVHGGDADCIIAEFEEKLNEAING